MNIRYEIVPESRVEPNLRYIAHDMLGFCIKDLNLKGKPKLEWIHELEYSCRLYGGEVFEFYMLVRGLARPVENIIQISIDGNIVQVMETAAHEARHIFQHFNYPSHILADKTAIEHDANSYAKDAGCALLKYWPDNPLDAMRCTKKEMYVKE